MTSVPDADLDRPSPLLRTCSPAPTFLSKFYRLPFQGFSIPFIHKVPARASPVLVASSSGSPFLTLIRVTELTTHTQASSQL